MSASKTRSFTSIPAARNSITTNRKGRARQRAVEREGRDAVEQGPARPGPGRHRRGREDREACQRARDGQGIAVKPDRYAAEEARAPAPLLGRAHGLDHRDEVPARRPQQQHQAHGEHHGHGQRLPHRGELAVPHLRNPRGGGEQHTRFHPPVGVEDHRLGRRQGACKGVREAVLQQGPAPGPEQPRAPRLALVLGGPRGDLERALQRELRFEQVRDHAEHVDAGLAPEHQRRGEPVDEPAHSAASPASAAAGSTAAAWSTRAPLRSASKGSARPAATSAQMRSPIGLPPI